MTNTERARYAANFMKRRTSRIVSAQNGYNDVMQFADGYTHDTLEDVNTDNGEPDTTTQVDPADQGNDGFVPREQPDEAWQTDVANALEHVNRAIQNVGANRSVDDGTLAGLNILASTMQALRELPSGVSIAKAVANPDGSTREPLVVNDNDSSSHAGSHGYIDVADLENAARKLTTLSSRICNVDRF